MGHAKRSAHLDSVVVQIDTNDLIRTRKTQALKNVQADAAQTEHDSVEPISTLAVLITAPIPVVTPQPM